MPKPAGPKNPVVRNLGGSPTECRREAEMSNEELRAIGHAVETFVTMVVVPGLLIVVVAMLFTIYKKIDR